MDYIFISMAHFAYHLKIIDATVHATPFSIIFLPKICQNLKNMGKTRWKWWNHRQGWKFI